MQPLQNARYQQLSILNCMSKGNIYFYVCEVFTNPLEVWSSLFGAPSHKLERVHNEHSGPS